MVMEQEAPDRAADQAAPPDRAAAAAAARRRSRPVRRNRHSTNYVTDQNIRAERQLRRTAMTPVKIQRSGIVSITGKIAFVLVTLVFGSIDLRAQAPQPPG